MATTVLPAPTSPWISRRHARAGREICSNFSEVAHLCAGEAEGQGGLGLQGQVAGADSRRRFGANAPLALGEGELVGQQLVERQAASVRRLE